LTYSQKEKVNKNSDLDMILGKYRDDIFSRVENLQGTYLFTVKDTIDILAGFDLGIKPRDFDISINRKAKGVSYSTDPDKQNT